jgi:hypothetical protein
MLATIPVDMIENGQRLREVSEAQVVALMDSIAQVGLLNPITVYPRQLYRGGVQVDGYGLIAGLHRKTACERLGLVEVEANILDLGDLERQIAECDENLCAPQLSPSDRARFTKRRKDAYEALHPETRHGVNQHTGGDANLATPNFAEDQAAKTGLSERVIARDAERGQKILPEVLDMIAGTKLDTGAYMDKLKSMPGSDQFKAAQRDLLHLRHLERQSAARPKVKIADAPLNDEAAQERQVAALMSAWNKASAEARTEFMARIDAPVFDRSAAA